MRSRCSLCVCVCVCVCSKLKGLLRKYQIRKLETRKSKKVEVWEEDYEKIDNEGLFEEYLEMGL